MDLQLGEIECELSPGNCQNFSQVRLIRQKVLTLQREKSNAAGYMEQCVQGLHATSRDLQPDNIH